MWLCHRIAPIARSQPRSYKNNNSGSIFARSCVWKSAFAIILFLDSLNTTGRLLLISRGLANWRRNIYFITKEPSEKREQFIILERHQYRNLIYFRQKNPEWIFLSLVRRRVTNALTLFSYLFFWSEYPKTNKFYQYVYI